LIIRVGKLTKEPESYSYENELKFLGFESIINKDIQVDDPNKTAEVVPMYLSPSIINSIICINTIATAIAIINPKNKYFISYLILKTDSIFFVLLN
jgi:hypothetical protein